jgi:hypothetical protein
MNATNLIDMFVLPPSINSDGAHVEDVANATKLGELSAFNSNVS